MYFEYTHHYLNDLGVVDVFSSKYNKLYVADEYHKFLKQWNIAFAFIGKPNRDRRCNFEKKMMLNENKKVTEAYNKLLGTLNWKNEQFQQNILINF